MVTLAVFTYRLLTRRLSVTWVVLISVGLALGTPSPLVSLLESVVPKRDVDRVRIETKSIPASPLAEPAKPPVPVDARSLERSDGIERRPRSAADSQRPCSKQKLPPLLL